ncbi:hypothetical protein DKT68_16110, partial [Micromonospora acroterricola]
VPPGACPGRRPPAADLGTPRVVRAPAPDDEPTQPLPPRRPDPLAEAATTAFRSPGRATGEPPLTRAGAPDPSAEETQAIPRGRPGEPGRFEPAEELPASIAEPVSGPPAPRRGFTPIVIEGTIIESRDLTDPAEASSTAGRPIPEPAAPPSFGDPSPGPRPFGPRPYGPPPSDPGPFGPSSTGPSSFGPSDPGPFSPSFGPASSDPGPFGPGSGGPTGAGPGSLHADDLVDDRPEGADRADLGGSPVGVNGTDRVGGAVGGEPVGVNGTDRAGSVGGDVPGGSGLGGQRPQPWTAGGAAAARPDADGQRAVPEGDGQHGPADGPPPVDFVPANTVEEDLLGAAGAGSTDTFLSTLLLARVLLPAAPDSLRGSRPGDPGFVWRTEQLDGETYVVVYTSPERLADHAEGDVDTVRVKFAQLIRRWPDEDWSFAVNPGTPVGAKLPGEQIVALANWAAEVGLGDDLEVDPEEPPVAAEPAARPRYAPAAVDPARPTVMQKAIAPSQLAYYLDRGYDRVSGFVHRAGELAHLTTPAQLHDALGLSYPGSPFTRDAEEIYVLRWPAHRPSLYRIPYGGQNEPAMRAMEGWVIERPPFRGNGFAPGESSDVVAEFKVDSARLPYGAQLWRIGADGTERVIAVLDTDALLWRRVGEA